MLIRRWTWILVAAVLSGCAGQISQPAGGVSSVSTVVLHRPLQVETGWARAFVQYGEPVKFSDRNRFDPVCSFEVRDVAHPGMHIGIEPDTFAITRIQHKHITGGIFAGALDIDEDVGPVEPEVDVYLASDRQPSVIRLRCVKWEADAIHARPVGLADIRSALGPLADIR